MDAWQHPSKTRNEEGGQRPSCQPPPRTGWGATCHAFPAVLHGNFSGRHTSDIKEISQRAYIIALLLV